MSDTLTKILFLAANPKGTARLRLDEEVRDIQAGLERARKREQFVLEQRWAVRPKDLRRAILDVKPRIVHLSGHGGGIDGLALENSRGQVQIVDTAALARLFEIFSNTVECVLLNACYSEIQAEAIAKHISYVIGMSQAIGDRAAIEFSVGFYDALGAGESIERAYSIACNAIEMEGIPEQHLPRLKKNSSVEPFSHRWLGSEENPSSNFTDMLASTVSLDSFEQEIACDTDEANQNQYIKAGALRRWLNSLKRSRYQIVIIGMISLAISAPVTAVRFSGILEPLELRALDYLMRMQPHEETDKRILVIAVTDQDVKNQDTNQRGNSSLSDDVLDQLLEKLQRYQPRVIGLDIYRDVPVGSEHKRLADRFQKAKELITICKVGETDNSDSIPPPKELKFSRLGFSDIRRDNDGVLRRQILGMAPGKSDCNTSISFSLRVALYYLSEKGISSKLTPDGNLRIGSVVVKTLEKGSGAYQQSDIRGYQVPLNYRASHEVAQTLTLMEFLNGKIPPEIVKDRIVLIGTTANSFKDYWNTSYGVEMPGVIIQAHMVSQIISAVLDNRHIITNWSLVSEMLWIFVWSLVGGILAGVLYSRLSLQLAMVIATGLLSGGCYIFLIHGIWVPLIPSGLGLVGTGESVLLYKLIQKRDAQNLNP